MLNRFAILKTVLYKNIALAALLLLLLGLSNCASTRPQKVKTPKTASSNKGIHSVGQIISGTASYYGKKFHGRLTANGETYNMYGLSAAHKTIPFGSKIKVTNLANSKSVTVLVNDRGPYAKGRILDLSYGAAKKLDYISKGTAKVRIEILVIGSNRYKSGGIVPLPNNVDTEQPPASSGSKLLLGSYKSKSKADRLYHYLKGRFKTIKLVKSGEDYKVFIGPFTSSKVRKAVYKRLKMEGYDVSFD